MPISKDKRERLEKDIEKSVAKWDMEQSVAKYVRKHLAETTDKGKTKMADVLDSLYHISIAGEKDAHKINAADKLLKIASMDQDREEKKPDVNIINQIVESTSSSIDELIDVTPKDKKKTVFDLI